MKLGKAAQEFFQKWSKHGELGIWWCRTPRRRMRARSLRDEAIDQVLAAASPAWKHAVHELIYYLPFGWEGIFEEIRFMAEAQGLWAHTPEPGAGSRRPRSATTRSDTRAQLSKSE